jgi:1-pyrroline-5-carboxylate dehydrogenase
VSDVLLTHPDLGGVHFTGSTGVFNGMWETIGRNMGRYRSYPRIVGETGGKDFILAHPSADPAALAVGIVRGAFEYQGQKCSAASRAYVPRSLWPEVKERVVAMMRTIRQGDVRDFRNFMGAVIDERSFTKIRATWTTRGATPPWCRAAAPTGSAGWFVEPTLVETATRATG